MRELLVQAVATARAAAAQAGRGELEPRPADMRVPRRLYVPDDLPM